jgi:hypothetical protein
MRNAAENSAIGGKEKPLKGFSNRIRSLATDVAKTAKFCLGFLTVFTGFFVLQHYFVRELVAAELLFGFGFAVLLVVVGIFYLVGVIGERVIDATQTGTNSVAEAARSSYGEASAALGAGAKRGSVTD